jgi:hypothetical protein
MMKNINDNRIIIYNIQLKEGYLQVEKNTYFNIFSNHLFFEL